MSVAMLAWALGASSLLAAAAWGCAALLRAHRRPQRAVWAAALFGGVVLSVLPFLAPIDSGAGGDTARIIERLPLGGPLAGFSDTLIPGFLVLWMLGSAGLTLFAAASALRHRRRLRLMRRAEVAGVEVWVSRNDGPAVWGALRPRVIVPDGVRQLPAGDQRLIVAHETEHLRAGDAQLNALAALAVAMVPWNPIAWLLRHQLGEAIEGDCDRRVLDRHRATAREYSELLLTVAAWGARAPLQLGMSRSGRLLMARIDRFLRPRPRRWTRVTGVAVVLGAACAAPLFPSPPSSPRESGAPATFGTIRQAPPSISTIRAVDRPAGTPPAGTYELREGPAPEAEAEFYAEERPEITGVRGTGDRPPANATYRASEVRPGN